MISHIIKVYSFNQNKTKCLKNTIQRDLSCWIDLGTDIKHKKTIIAINDQLTIFSQKISTNKIYKNRTKNIYLI